MLAKALDLQGFCCALVLRQGEIDGCCMPREHESRRVECDFAGGRSINKALTGPEWSVKVDLTRRAVGGAAGVCLWASGPRGRSVRHGPVRQLFRPGISGAGQSATGLRTSLPKLTMKCISGLIARSGSVSFHSPEDEFSPESADSPSLSPYPYGPCLRMTWGVTHGWADSCFESRTETCATEHRRLSWGEVRWLG
jgi:hypothetical protein